MEQIDAAADWWLRNRDKAPFAVHEDLSSAFDLISHHPGAGQPQEHPKLPGLRRLGLPRLGMHLYYHVLADPERIEVLALWHGSRERPPEL